MLDYLERNAPPLTLLSQYLPAQYEAVREGRLRNRPADLLKEGVARVLRQYMDACTAGAATRELETC
jgi:D-tagatose-1,6-bisphosphate aldolase subunit GatZ/KbaZ